MSETWDTSYVIVDNKGVKFTLKIVHYQSYGEFAREWYRIIPQNFDMSKTASAQPFGFGKTPDEAFKRYFASLDMNARTA